MFRDQDPCTKDDYVSVADKNKLQINWYGKSILEFHGSGFTLSFNKVAYKPTLGSNLTSLRALDDVGKHVTIGRGHIILCDTVLNFDKRFGKYVGRADRSTSRDYGLSKSISCNNNQVRYQARAALIRPGDNSHETVDTNLCILVTTALMLVLVTIARQLGVALTGPLPPCKGCSLREANMDLLLATRAAELPSG